MDIKGILSKVGLIGATVGAGAVGTMTGGALTPLTNTLLATLGKALDPTAKQQLELAVQQQAEQLQKDEYDHAEKIATITEQDMASARARETVVKDWVPRMLALLVTAGFFGLLWFHCQHSIPVENRGTLDIMLGSLGTAWLSIIAYYFGSSSGSADKTEIIAKMQGGEQKP